MRCSIPPPVLCLLACALLLAACSRQPTQAAGRKLIVIGVDGMDPVFLERHWASLPNLNQLRQRGDFKRLATTIPPQSPVAWSSVITGMDPGGHGIFDFVRRDPATRMPASSMSEVSEPAHTITIGPYVIPLSAGRAHTLRTGRAFWQLLSEQGVPARVIRMPANFPPADCEAESLAGMGTPDLTGTNGTFSFFTDNPAETREEVPGGRIRRVDVINGRATLRVEGPVNGLRKDRATTSVDLIVHVDPDLPAARFDLADRQFLLQEGEWSEWVRADFKLVPGLKSASGIFRVYLRKTHPHLAVYVSPVNLDPEDPALPISTPPGYSRKLAGKLGPFYTQGIAEDTSAYRAGVLSKYEFLTQSKQVLSDSLRMFRHELDRFTGGLLFYYFSSVDQNAHMLWGRYEPDLLEIYQAIDGAIGEAMRKAGADTGLLVMSDHGFARFDRAVHLNTFLMQQGFLVLDEPADTGDTALFAHVDWTRSVAYAMGLNGIYVNLEGRENGGIVSPASKRIVLDQIAARLKTFTDPVSGERVVDRVYFPETAFKGRNVKDSPDLIVGFRAGYRASWQTALGAVPAVVLEDNTDAWIGDHCIAADEVPGVLLSNRKVRATAPQLVDITATILNEFGIAKTAAMIGQNVY
jgi:predicted AlkP superfamily phosphohydrolase/phosphomutase